MKPATSGMVRRRGIAAWDPGRMADMFDHPSWTGEPLETFPAFPELPMDIRIMIWREIETQTIPARLVTTYLAPRPLPPLHTCQESRAECLRRHADIAGPSPAHRRHRPLYLNARRDTLGLRLDGRNLPDVFPHAAALLAPTGAAIRRVLVDDRFVEGVLRKWEWVPAKAVCVASADVMAYLQRAFPGLRQLVVRVPYWSFGAAAGAAEVDEADAEALPWCTREYLERGAEETIPRTCRGRGGMSGYLKLGVEAGGDGAWAAVRGLVEGVLEGERRRLGWGVEIVVVGWKRRLVFVPGEAVEGGNPFFDEDFGLTMDEEESF